MEAVSQNDGLYWHQSLMMESSKATTTQRFTNRNHNDIPFFFQRTFSIWGWVITTSTLYPAMPWDASTDYVIWTFDLITSALSLRMHSLGLEIQSHSLTSRKTSKYWHSNFPWSIFRESYYTLFGCTEWGARMWRTTYVFHIASQRKTVNVYMYASLCTVMWNTSHTRAPLCI